MKNECMPPCLADLREDLQAIADRKDAVSVTVHGEGPYLVRGSFTLLDARGQVIPSGRSTVALCRCGRSRQKPFCDGAHKALRSWRDAPAASSGKLLAGGESQRGSTRSP